MKKYLSLAFAFMLVLGMSFPALMADAYFEEDSKKENIIKTELSDTSLSDEAISFLAENNISLDSKVTPNSEVMSEGNGNTEYIGVLNEAVQESVRRMRDEMDPEEDLNETWQMTL